MIKDMPLSRCSTWKIGGTAQKAYQPESIAELQSILQSLAPTEPIFFLGLGSNTLVRAGGIRGAVILLRGRIRGLVLKDNDIHVQAGVACGQLARFAARNNLGGLEFLAGIPGTIGGSLTMNAGAHGAEIWQTVQTVTTIDRAGVLHKETPDAFFVGYRQARSLKRECWFIEATFRCVPTESAIALQKIQHFLEHRERTQPIHLPNGGCVFRNPKEDYAGRLIEQCGLKGYRIGGAEVSYKHANFIVHEGNATPADVERLAQTVSDIVYDKTGVRLIQELHIVGEKEL